MTTLTTVGLSYRCDSTSYLQMQLYNLYYASYMVIPTFQEPKLVSKYYKFIPSSEIDRAY
jgi:hypothetical protein